jgi:nucleoside transporter
MFGQYLMLGVWFVPLGAYMSKALHFDGVIGLAYAAQGVAAIFSSLFVGVVADRLVAAQKVLVVLMAASAASLLALAMVSGSQTAFLVLVLAHFLVFVPTIPLSTAIALNALPDPAAQFASVRACGTLGWIAGGLLVGSIPGAALTHTPMLIAAACGLGLGVLALALPPLPPRDRGRPFSAAGALGLDVVGRQRGRSFWAVVGCAFLISVALAFYNAYGNTFLQEAGAAVVVFGKRFEPSAIQSLGQMAELGFILSLPFVLRRIGIGGVLVIGMLAWIARCLLFAIGFSGSGQTFTAPLILGILLHGACYDFVMIAASLYVGASFEPAARSRAQAFLTIATMGAGVTLGSVFANAVYGAATVSAGRHLWWLVWSAPGAVAAATLILFAASFRGWRVTAG